MYSCSVPGPRRLQKARDALQVFDVVQQPARTRGPARTCVLAFLDALQFEVQTLCAFCVALPMPQACALLCGHRVGLVSGTHVIFRSGLL